MSDFQAEANRSGFELLEQLPAQSARAVYRARRRGQDYVLKWPEQGPEGEQLALEFWSPELAPRFEALTEDAYALKWLNGRHPYHWTGHDRKLISEMLGRQGKMVPGFLDQLKPLRVHVNRLIGKVARARYWSAEGVEALQKAQRASLGAREGLVHGDLHPWNLFVSDRAQVIDPYGLRGDQGFDLAFLAASLAHDQEVFLAALSEQLGLDTAPVWFPGLVAYRLDNCLRHRAKAEGQVLKDLANRLFG